MDNQELTQFTPAACRHIVANGYGWCSWYAARIIERRRIFKSGVYAYDTPMYDNIRSQIKQDRRAFARKAQMIMVAANWLSRQNEQTERTNFFAGEVAKLYNQVEEESGSLPKVYALYEGVRWRDV